MHLQSGGAQVDTGHLLATGTVRQTEKGFFAITQQRPATMVRAPWLKDWPQARDVTDLCSVPLNVQPLVPAVSGPLLRQWERAANGPGIVAEHQREPRSLNCLHVLGRGRLDHGDAPGWTVTPPPPLRKR